ncbi:MAG: hypothetical protein MJY89_08285 [Bacteroidales bacterium]|nr:hypothetical protein [Bacteroidales bacterium]
MKKNLLVFAALAGMTACAEKGPNTLVLYYSQSGTTEAVALELQKQTGADIERFDVVEAYEGDFNAVVARCAEERASGFVPTLAPLTTDLSKYDVIFLGYPIWSGTYATPVKVLLESVDFTGKKVVPFCTFGSGGLESSAADVAAALPGTEIADGFGIRQARVQYAAEELADFLVAQGYVEGDVEALPEYSDFVEVTPETAAIFEEATSGYMFPLGTAVSVASREVPGGVDYQFVAASAGFDGTPVESMIYVVCREGRPAEFTKVVR